MAAIDDLNTAVSGLQGEVNTVVAALGANNDAAIETATASINAAVAQLQAALPQPPAPPAA